MRDASARGQAFVIPLLVAVINRGAWKYAIAIVLVGTNRTYEHVGRAKRDTAVDGLSKKSIGHEAEASRVVAGVIKGQIDVAGDRVNGKPLIEAVDELRKLIGHRMRGSPGKSTIIGKGKQDVGHTGGGEIHPGAIEAAAVRPR